LQLCSHRLAEINAEEHLNQTVTTTGVVTVIRSVITKKTNQEMAFATVEDGSAKLDIVIFPKLYHQVKAIFQVNSAYLIRGQVNQREDELSLIVEALFTPETLPAGRQAAPTAPNSSNFDLVIPRHTTKPVLEQLSQLLKAYPGFDRLILVLPNGSNEVKRLNLPYGVRWNQDLRQQAEVLLSSTP